MRFLFIIFLGFILQFEVSGQKFQSVFYPDEISTTSIIIKGNFGTDKNGAITNPELNDFLSQTSGTLNQLFPNLNSNKTEGNSINLSNIYRIDYPYKIDPLTLSKQISNFSQVEYAEPMIIPKLCFTPSDARLSEQYQLEIIKAFQAWDIEKGDSNVVIGITDTGADLYHPDLTNKIAYNYDDPINGIDDDGDGYIDNYFGWDTGDNDNNPSSALTSSHGDNVAGLAAAETNNGIGIAGTGFLCRFLPIKIEDTTGQLSGAYQGIVYAADQGVDIINCSWGSYSASNFGNDIINYATNKGSLVICGAGNDGRDAKFYPSAYENAMAIGMTDSFDIIRNNSNYGNHIDILAVGQGMITTARNGQYSYNGGTSMASPLVSGAAALVKSRYPNFTPIQISEHLRNTADDVSAKQPNQYTGKIGGGRLNMFAAVNNPLKPGVRATLLSIVDGNDSAFVAGDTLRLTLNFINYLAPGANFTAQLSTTSQSVRILKGTHTIGSLNTLEEKNNQSAPFLIILNNRGVSKERIDLKVTIRENNYTRENWFETTINVDFINFKNNDISTTLTSNGRIGFSNLNAGEGRGFIYKDNFTALYEGSFLIGNSNTVSDGFRGENQQTSADFKVEETVKQIIPQKANHEFQGIFSAINNSDFEVQHKSYFYSQNADQNFVIHAYKIIAKADLNDFYASALIDWDILDYSKNKCGYDASNNLAYSYSTETNSPYFGIKLLSHNTAIPFALDNVSGGGSGGVDISNGFTKAEKFSIISTYNPIAGNVGPNGNDILSALSYGPFSISKDSSMVVAFSISAADSLTELQNLGAVAKNLYITDQLGEFSVKRTPPKTYTFNSNVYPNPGNGIITIDFTLERDGIVEIKLFNALGQEVFGKTQYGFYDYNAVTFNAIEFGHGVYFLTIKADGKQKLHKIVLN